MVRIFPLFTQVFFFPLEKNPHPMLITTVNILCNPLQNVKIILLKNVT
jgi:hypothetical protein